MRGHIKGGWTMQSIERAIQKLVWDNDKGIDSDTARILAILEALNEIAEQLAKINQAIRFDK